MFATAHRRFTLVLATIGLLLATTGGIAAASHPADPDLNWAPRFPSTSPPARNNQAMAFDPESRTVVVFGGYGLGTCGTFCDDTWTFNGKTWTKRFASHPPLGRNSAAMAFDERSQRVILFGGNGQSGFLGDTWALNEDGWHQLHPAVSPAARGYIQMAYDDATGTIVLFGGQGSAGTLGDTWIWKSGAWTQGHPANSPSPRYEYSMAYNAASKKVVLFGGIDGSGAFSDETWSWDGNNWTRQLSSNAPSPRAGAAMGYDSTTHSSFLFGGFSFTPSLNVLGDTWTWNGRTWTQRFLRTSPPPRSNGRIVFDSQTETAVLFGGCNTLPSCGTLLNDLWVLRSAD